MHESQAPSRVRARFLWEASCERLRNVLSPVPGAPIVAPVDAYAALQLAREALDAVERVFEMKKALLPNTDPRASTGNQHAVHRDVIAIGAAEDSLPALRTLLSALPMSLPATLLLALADEDRLEQSIHDLLRQSRLPICYADDGAEALPGCVYVAPPGHTLIVRASGRLGFEQLPLAPAEGGVIDRLFWSVAQWIGPRAIALVLAGSGADGAAGMSAIEAADGVGIVLDPGDAANPEKPAAVLARDHPHYVAPLRDLPTLVHTLVHEKARVAS